MKDIFKIGKILESLSDAKNVYNMCAGQIIRVSFVFLLSDGFFIRGTKECYLKDFGVEVE